jgi:hypothetical protein
MGEPIRVDPKFGRDWKGKGCLGDEGAVNNGLVRCEDAASEEAQRAKASGMTSDGRDCMIVG